LSCKSRRFYITRRVTLEITGIGKHPKEKFESRFLDRSFEIKIVDFIGKNYSFAVPKLANQIIPEQSKWWTKDNKVIIKLKKFKKEDNWSSLFKTKAIGDDE
jgi:CS domain